MLIFGPLARCSGWFGAEIGDDGRIGGPLQATALSMTIHANTLLDDA